MYPTTLEEPLRYPFRFQSGEKPETEDDKAKLKGKILTCGALMGLLQDDASAWLGYGNLDDTDTNQYIEELIEKRNAARKNKDFAEADRIRDELKTQNIEIEDTAQGTIWKKA